MKNYSRLRQTYYGMVTHSREVRGQLHEHEHEHGEHSSGTQKMLPKLNIWYKKKKVEYYVVLELMGRKMLLLTTYLRRFILFVRCVFIILGSLAVSAAERSPSPPPLGPGRAGPFATVGSAAVTIVAAATAGRES